MKIHVHGGTARHDEPSLCLSCRSAKLVRGCSSREEITWCSNLNTRVTFRVTSCSEYLHRDHPSLWHMEDIAWILRTDSKRKQVGFVRSRDLRAGERHVLFEDDD
ncbi:MAG TPA: hypothetical protein VG538_00890 [Vicinamibacterales bacterium]|nr:hypothetical protein [Vicinamibacterales bacterium]